MDVIQAKMLRSPELTGQWEKKLRDIEQGCFTLESFMDELQAQLVSDGGGSVNEVGRRGGRSRRCGISVGNGDGGHGGLWRRRPAVARLRRCRTLNGRRTRTG